MLTLRRIVPAPLSGPGAHPAKIKPPRARARVRAFKMCRPLERESSSSIDERGEPISEAKRFFWRLSFPPPSPPPFLRSLNDDDDYIAGRANTIPLFI